MKICLTCNLEYIQSSNTQKYCCIECRKIGKKEYDREYRNRNKELISCYMKEWASNNKEQISIKMGEYYEENKNDIVEKKKKYYEENKDIILEVNRKYREGNKNSISEQQRKWYEENKSKIKENRKEYNKNNKEEIKIRTRKYYEVNREKIYKSRKIYRDLKFKTDNLYKLTEITRNLIRISIKNNGFSKKSRTYEILGISYEEFKIYIENQFLEGMTWENHGEWHLDHKTPVSWGKTEEEIIELNYYINFQPMWAFDNLSKGNRYETIDIKNNENV